MQIGSSPGEYTTHSVNQQNNQSIGRLPNWQSRLGMGSSGGGLNLKPLNLQNNPLGGIGQNPGGVNPAMMIHALMGRSA